MTILGAGAENTGRKLHEAGEGRVVVIIPADAAGQALHPVERGERVLQRADDKTEPPEKILRGQRRDVTAQRLAEARQPRLEFPGEKRLREGQWFDERASDEPRAMPAVLVGSGIPFEKRAGEDLHEHGQRHRLVSGLLFGLVEHG